MQILEKGYRYELDNFEGGIKTRLDFIQMKEGTVLRNGTTNEEVLKVVLDRLVFLDAKLPDEYTQAAAKFIKKALYVLEERTAKRKEAGIIGKDIETPIYTPYELSLIELYNSLELLKESGFGKVRFNFLSSGNFKLDKQQSDANSLIYARLHKILGNGIVSEGVSETVNDLFGIVSSRVLFYRFKQNLENKKTERGKVDFEFMYASLCAAFVKEFMLTYGKNASEEVTAELLEMREFSEYHNAFTYFAHIFGCEYERKGKKLTLLDLYGELVMLEEKQRAFLG